MPLFPYFLKNAYLPYFLLVWTTFTGLHTFVIYNLVHNYFWFAFIDAALSYFLLTLLSVGLWFFIRALPDNSKNGTKNFLGLVIVGIIISVAWSYGVIMTLSSLNSLPPAYADFLEHSTIFRFAVGIIFYASIANFYYMIIYKESSLLKQKYASEMEQQKREAELNLLKTQIKPHFLFNALNSASSLIVQQPEKAREMIIELSDFLRYVVKNSQIERPELSLELENIRRYMNLESIRFGDRLIYNEVVEEIALSSKLPGMILQPIFENAIKHGVHESLKPIHVLAEFRMMGNFLLVRIENEIDPESIRSTAKGTGLNNISERLKLIYQRNDLLNIQKTKSTFMVELRIPQTK
ncbi:MAG: histidine kinase [Bacteroidales bacterium]|jgi:sensor histidine kinase YesM|nr:histidine kinase [Bacteroidales bacterium]